MKRNRLFILCALTVSHAALADLIDNGDGTVTDTSTGLMWLQNPKQAGAPMSWTDALAWADDLDFAGHTDWRLPGAGFLPSGTFCVEGGTLSNGGCNQGYYISRPGAQLATLYLNTLGNQPYCSFDDPTTTWPVCDESDRNPDWTNPSNGGPFVDVNGRFWLNQGMVGLLAMYFDMVTGVQGADIPSQPAAFPWAIRGERPKADLSITMTDGVTSLNSGDSVTYTYVVTNTGISPHRHRQRGAGRRTVHLVPRRDARRDQQRNMDVHRFRRGHLSCLGRLAPRADHGIACRRDSHLHRYRNRRRWRYWLGHQYGDRDTIPRHRRPGSREQHGDRYEHDFRWPDPGTGSQGHSNALRMGLDHSCGRDSPPRDCPVTSSQQLSALSPQQQYRPSAFGIRLLAVPVLREGGWQGRD